MVTTTLPRPKTAAPSAADQIEGIVKTFGLTTDPNDLHGSDLRSQLLSSYIEWLAIEQRVAASELWPQINEPAFQEMIADGYRCIPDNTRWGDWHFSRDRWPKTGWTDFKHPVTRAALVLWTVGAIDDIPDPLSDLIDAIRVEAAALDSGTIDAEDAGQIANWNQSMAAKFARLRAGALTPTTMHGAANALRFAIDDLDLDADEQNARAIIPAVIRFLEREDPIVPDSAERPKPAAKDDPVHSAIEAWREARATWDAFADDTPDEDAAYAAADDREYRCWDRMLKCVPATPAGLRAWTSALNEDRQRERVDTAGDIDIVLNTMALAAAAIAERLPVDDYKATFEGSGSDPLAGLIADFDDGNRRYREHPICKAVRFDGEAHQQAIAETYGPAYQALQNDPPAPTTLQGVHAALRLIADEEIGDEIVLPVARAACRFFEQAAASLSSPLPDPVSALKRSFP